MQFCEKLDFLMNITQTKNSTLALNIKLDASHISRLRRGQRNALKDETCIKNMSQYFAKHFNEDYQRKALADMLNISLFQIDETALSNLIKQWLLNETKDETKKNKKLYKRLYKYKI